MSFSIECYYNKAEPNRLDKTDYLQLYSNITGTLREECDLVNPTITLELNYVPQFNYVYIPIFNRYYFVNNFRNIRNKLWEMQLHCDVLMTYKTEILACGGIVGRTGNAYSPYIRDEEIPVESRVEFERIELGEIVCDGYESAPMFSDGLVTDNDRIFVLQVYRT